MDDGLNGFHQSISLHQTYTPEKPLPTASSPYINSTKSAKLPKKLHARPTLGCLVNSKLIGSQFSRDTINTCEVIYSFHNNCQLYGIIDSYLNQFKGSHLIAASILASRMNHYAIQTALAVMAEESAKQTLNAAITYTIIKEKKALSIRFDYFCSYSYNAKQFSSEFIYLEKLENYGHKAIEAFHIVEKSRVITKKGKDRISEEKVVIHEGNFNASSCQMEHAILIALLKQIIPILEKSDLLLEVCIDGDLDSNKTLANVSIYIRSEWNGIEQD
ncbi:hypothetical protein C1645_822389 [Glomus cerebriforme]|uniref:Uncharacterized protein n=1 Tax=Glomus cerebriforme TaxID=658196 RepID=A0A397T4K1_9GLOM|nr:hypothetical protein C1645_822389 [Glomus cerebriforme]